MYKLKTLIDNGLDVNTLPDDLKKDVEYIIKVTNNFEKESNIALELDTITSERIESEILNPETKPEDNLFIADNYFKNNPDHVLGEQTSGGRFGNSVVVKGDPSIVDNIDVMMPEKVFKEFIGDQPLEKEKISERIKKVVEKTTEAITEEKNKKIIRVITQEESENPEIMSFREVVEKYNQNISRKELEAFLYSRPDLPYSKYIDKFENEQSQLMNEGLLYWDDGRIEYSHIFLSGDIHVKRTNTVRNKESIIEQFGEDFYESQFKALDNNMPEYIRISENKTGINLLPHSEFSKTFELPFGDFMFNSSSSSYINKDYKISLYSAFKDYYLRNINRSNPGLFSGSNYRNIQYYLIGKKISTKSRSSKEDKKLQEKEEKYAWQKAKEIADRLFIKMLNEEITLEGKKNLEIIWNEKYNTYRLPDYSKIPVGFTISKFFNDKELELNSMQRESVGFMNYIGSGINAGSVGAGKTIASLASISQSIETGKASFPLLIVPNNVYEKWIRDIMGYYNDEKGKQYIGALHHYPKMRRLYNMSPDIIYSVKKYTDEERKAIENLKENFELIREQKRKISELKQIPQEIFNANDNPYASTALEAFEMAEKRVKNKLEKLQKDFNNFISQASNISDEYIARKTSDYEKLIKKENEKLPDDFTRIYYNLVKDEYVHLIYDTGKFEEVPAGTITIITHDAIKGNYLGVRDSDILIQRLYEILSQGDRFEDPREATKLYEKIVSRVESVVGNSKLFIEDLGIDYLIIDEAHAFKKIFTSLKGEVKTNREGEVVQREVTKEGQTTKFAEREMSYYDLDYGEPSGIALSGYFLTQYIQMMNEGKNTLLLTATPFENSPLEIYGMLSMANHEQLQKYGYTGIKEFFDTFMKIEYDYKVKINGVERDTVLNGFVNLPQLRTIVRNVILHRTGEQIEGLVRPDKVILPLFNSDLFDNIHEVKTMLVPTDEQKDLIKKIEAYINGEISLNEIQFMESEKQLIEDMLKEEEKLIEEQFSEGTVDDVNSLAQAKKNLAIDSKLQTESESEGTRIIQGINYIKQITCSPYMLKLRREAGMSMPTAKEFVETSPKLMYVVSCIKSIKKHHEEKLTPISGQIIYMTWGKMFFSHIKEYLTDPQFGIGFAKDEVEIITGDLSKNKKEEFKKAFNDNKIKVLIASKSIQVGADLQKNTSVLYHIFYDWNPTDNEQVNGRMWRQGNKHMAVRIVYPMVENSIDPVIFQYLEEKTLRIKDVWDLSSVKSQLDLSEFDPRKLKVDAITDPEKKAKLAIAVEKEKLSEELSYYRNILDPIRNVPYIINQFKNSLTDILEIQPMFFEAEKLYKQRLLKNEQSEKEDPVSSELLKIREPIASFEEEINNIETGYDEKVQLLNESIAGLDDQLNIELNKVKAQITDAVIEGNDELVNSLRKQYKDLPKVYQDNKKNDIENKIAQLEREKAKSTEKQRSEIEKLTGEIGEKIEKLNNKLEDIKARYEKKITESDEYYDDKVQKVKDQSLFESKEKYYTFLYSNCTDIIKFLDIHSEESGYYENEFSQIKYKSYDYKMACTGFKQYRDEYYRAIKLYLEPMSIKEEDAEQVVQVYQSKINEIVESINNVDDLYHELYKKYDEEYQHRMAQAKTPQECANDFAKLNFLLDHIRIEELEQPEYEEIIPENIDIEVPEVDEIQIEESQEKEFVPDEKYISGKIKIFERVLGAETDEKLISYLKIKIKLFNRVLGSMKKPVEEKEMVEEKMVAVEQYSRGGLIWIDKKPSRKMNSYIDLVNEGLMSKKDFVTYMKARGEKILPQAVYNQIRECSNYDMMVEIFSMNDLV
jgi:hypothetical protein